jgi:hypothetical protein
LLTSEGDEADRDCRSRDLAVQRRTVVLIRRRSDESLTPAPRRIASTAAETRNHVSPAILRCREHSKLVLSR